ncbi:g1633 [Coccomyxa viridis]|uniref:G1633 protein n=1 Tax=Coccomyxa viridis TaxID=1274662 RepID=A0ABP1FIH2_9CHLO
MCAAPAISTEVADDTYTWTGEDEFDSLNDRRDAPPLPLPSIREARRVALVRHGQSTWNAQGRVQGSSNLSYLTKKGESQAETTGQLLKDDKFDMLFHSPLKRADQTAQIIWGSRQGDVSVLPSLREVDLYSFQGLLKDEGKARYGDQYKKWQQDPAGFEIDNQAPIRELWYRGSMAWQDILGAPGIKSALVVAHNAVNQALLNTALGLPPTFFRRLLQSNGATSVIDFQPNGDGPPTRTIDRINQSPGSPFGTPKPGSGRIVLVRTGAAEGHREGLLLGVRDDPLSTLGRVQGSKAAELMMEVKVDEIYSSPLTRAKETAQSIADLQSLAGFSRPSVSDCDDLNNRDWGSLEGRDASEVSADASGAAEPVDAFWERCGRAWSMLQAAAHEDGGKTVAVVTHSSVISGILCRSLEMGPADLSLFRTGGGSITLIGFPGVAQADTMHKGVIQCTNFTAHLGRWAVPVTRDDAEYAVCGIDGCF